MDLDEGWTGLGEVYRVLEGYWTRVGHVLGVVCQGLDRGWVRFVGCWTRVGWGSNNWLNRKMMTCCCVKCSTCYNVLSCECRSSHPEFDS